MGFKNIVAAGSLLLATVAVPALAQIKVACVGNSITYGYGLNGATTYPQHLQYVLGETYQVENFGNSGKMFHKASSESYWSQTTFKDAYEFTPNIVVIELGTNDSKYFYSGTADSYNYYFYEYKQDSQGKNYTRESLIAEMKKDYEALIDTFLNNNHTPEIYVTLQPYANNLGWFITDTAIVNVINPMIKEVAEKKRVKVIDLHAKFNKPEWLLDDNVHPNAEGAKALAEIIGEGILNGPVMTGPVESSSSVVAGSSSAATESSAATVQSSSSAVTVESSSSKAAISSNSSEIVSSSSETTTIRTNVEVPKAHVSVLGQSLLVNNYKGDIFVFDMNGNRVKTGYSSGQANISINSKGVFIVKTGDVIQKVVFK